MLTALRLTEAQPNRQYMFRGITVAPEPPLVGRPVRLALALLNPGPDSVTIRQVTFAVARYGMGVRWETLPPLGALTVPPDPARSLELTTTWTPTDGGHRCVTATVDLGDRQIVARRNLHVIEADADQRVWQAPFQLGNPTAERAPVALVVGGREILDASINVGGRVHRLNQPLWLEPDEEIAARLILRARTDHALDAVTTVEAYLHGEFLDGIAVAVRRPAFQRRHAANFERDLVHA